MIREEFTFKDADGWEISVYKWSPGSDTKVKGIVQIAHGMAERAERYERFAKALTDEGYVVYANDHRGHGRTAGSIENIGYCGTDGFNWMVNDLKQLNEIITKENPGLPVYLFGHSMGSFLAQSYISLYPESIKGVILSGTAGKQGIMLDLGLQIAKREIRKSGDKMKSRILHKLAFEGYNNGFKPARTGLDWLSRDEEEVDKYINDPYCGTVFTAGFYYDLFKGLKMIHREDIMRRIPKELPIYIFSGQRDPLGKNCKTVLWLIRNYKKIGIKDVTYRFYKDGRHEMLNEINRDEVTSDVIVWLDAH